MRATSVRSGHWTGLLFSEEGIAEETVQLLNNWVDGMYIITRRDQVTKYHIPTENNCEQCHGSRVPGVPEPALRASNTTILDWFPLFKIFIKHISSYVTLI